MEKAARDGCIQGSAAEVASTPCRTASLSTFLASCRRRRPCRRACSPAAGATSGGLPQACALGGGVMAQGRPRRRWKEHRELVDRLLLLRGGAPLDTCDIRLGEFEDDDVPRVNFWVWHAISCKVGQFMLSIHSHCYLELDNLPFVSQHLTRLELCGVWIGNSFLDFSSCPALEYLELHRCNLVLVKNISSVSLKHLSITECPFPYCDLMEVPSIFIRSRKRTHIFAPNLISLRLDGFDNLTPMLDGMPSLVEAFVRMTDHCGDYCDWNYCLCELCDSSCCTTGSGCVLLKGLSKAKSLVLVCTASDRFLQIFKWHLRWCPVFSKLKTLVLNEYWCMPDDFSLMLCILEHSPVLEELTLELYSKGPKHEVEMKGSTNLRDQSAKISENLNIVKIKCQAVDLRVLKVLKFLHSFDIRNCKEDHEPLMEGVNIWLKVPMRYWDFISGKRT